MKIPTMRQPAQKGEFNIDPAFKRQKIASPAR